ncbi:MAG: hypothetical protein QOE35_2327 [Actinomycetota bacterium]|jgi:hypothetical protein
MDRLIIAAVLIVVAVLVAGLLQRLRDRADAPTQSRWAVPTQLDRADFDGRDTPWLVALFTSETCDSCARARQKTAVLASPSVVVQDVPYQLRKDLHTRYAVEVVPMILVAGPDGVVAASFVGVPTATDLWAAVAEARAPGASPEPDLGRP